MSPVLLVLFFKIQYRTVILQGYKKVQADATKDFSMTEAEKGRANVPLKE
jgi:hypothetical protein